MAVDNLSRLEKRVEALLEHLEGVIAENADLQQAASQASEQAGRAEELEAENKKLRTQLNELEEEVLTMTGKEDAVRDRLQGMLEKIDAIEQGIGAAQDAD